VIKVLNLYAGIGGNRKLWQNVDVTAVESVPDIANVYEKLYPDDTVIVTDAHQYLLEHFREFDVIWSSPPCPTHSRVRTSLINKSPAVYPDMKLYEEIILLKHFFKGEWIVENVVSYYDPLIPPTNTIDRHYVWASKAVPNWSKPRSFDGAVTNATKETLSEYHGIELPTNMKNQRKVLRNAVHPEMGLHIFEAITQTQAGLLDEV